MAVIKFYYFAKKNRLQGAAGCVRLCELVDIQKRSDSVYVITLTVSKKC